MATLQTNQLTLADWAKRLDPTGRTVDVAEMLTQTNEILADAVFVPGNLPTGHRVVIRTGLPQVYYRMINAGIPISKSTTTQVDEACAILEARSHIDIELVKLNADNAAAFRMSEDRAFIESMNQAMADAMFYGNPGIDPRQFLGFATRYSSLTAGNGANIIDAGGTGTNNASVWLIVWGDDTVFCPFPKGSNAGLDHRDLGEESVQDANGNYYQAVRSLYTWKNGLVVKDWRYVVRIANINTADLLSQSATQASSAATAIIKLMIRAMDRVPNLNMGKAVFYANRTIYSMLRVAALDKSNNALSITEAAGQFGTARQMTNFMGVPLRKVDRLLNTESRVV